MVLQEEEIGRRATRGTSESEAGSFNYVTPVQKTEVTVGMLMRKKFYADAQR